MKKEQLVKLAQNTLDIVKIGHYKTPSGKVVHIITKGSILYLPDHMFSDDFQKGLMDISVTQETTMVAAQRLVNENVCILNFASAKNPGGGFLKGAVAQEECLARSSTLYHSIKDCSEFYKQAKNSPGVYDDHIIYSPEVTFFKDDDGKLLEDPYTVAVVTAAAPNINLVKSLGNDVEETYDAFYTRIENVLKVMATKGHKTIVLGAWGCGAFGNDPYIVSDFFADILGAYPAFDKVVFAIYDSLTSATYQAFESTFTQEEFGDDEYNPGNELYEEK